jgi:hypothetical protein
MVRVDAIHAYSSVDAESDVGDAGACELRDTVFAVQQDMLVDIALDLTAETMA